MGSSSIGTRLAHVKSVCACQWRGLTHSPGESRLRAPCWACLRCPGRRSRAQPPHGVSGCASSRRFLSLPHGSTHRDHATLCNTCGLTCNRLLKSQIGTVRIRRRGRCARSRHTRAQSAVHLCDPAMPTQHAAARLTHPARHPAHPPTRYPLEPCSFPRGICGHVSPVPESTPPRHITRPRVFVSCT